MSDPLSDPLSGERRNQVKNLGIQIVIVDNGFVYVGECYWEEDFLKISNAKNIRIWGTTKGLGQLISGPTKSTVTDDCGTCLVPKPRVVSFLKTEGEKW